MFTTFPVAEIDSVVRRTLRSAAVAGVLGVVIAIVAGQPLVAPGLALGLVLAVLNHRVFQASAMRFTTPEGVVDRRPFAGSVFLRLGACTAVTIVTLIFIQPMGWGVIGGLALFQLLMLLNALIALLRYQRSQVKGPGAGDA